MKTTALIEKRHRKNLLFGGKSVNFRADTVRLPDGKKAVREFMEHKGAAAVLPVLPGNKIIFVRQYRYPVGRITLEIPAGKLHSVKDAPRERAAAELKEETGYTARRLDFLMDFWPTPAFSSELLRIYVASGLRQGERRPDEDEFLDVEIIPFSKAWELLEKGAIKDSKTIIALQAYKLLVSDKPGFFKA